MQHPVGITVNADRSRAEMNDVWAVLTQPLNIWAYSHVIAGAILSGAAMFAGISSYFLMKQRDVPLFRKSVRLGLVGMLIGAVATLVTGDLLAKVMTDVQPMKMASAEALYNTSTPASFSIFTIGSLDGTSRGLLHPGARCAVVHGHRIVQRHRRGDQRRPGAVRGEVRTG